MLTSLVCASAFMALPPGSSHRSATGMRKPSRGLLRRPSPATCDREARFSGGMGTLLLENSASRAQLPIPQLVDADQISKFVFWMPLALIHPRMVARDPVCACAELN